MGKVTHISNFLRSATGLATRGSCLPFAARTRSLASYAGVAMVLSLSSCSTRMTKKQCEETDYYKMGMADGKEGRPASHLQEVANECGKFGVEPATPQYGYGREAGLKEFCSEGNARKDAKNSKSDSICWQEAVPSYQTAYKEALGKRETDKRKDLAKSVAGQAEADQKNKAINTELEDIEKQKAAH